MLFTVISLLAILLFVWMRMISLKVKYSIVVFVEFRFLLMLVCQQYATFVWQNLFLNVLWHYIIKCLHSIVYKCSLVQWRRYWKLHLLVAVTFSVRNELRMILTNVICCHCCLLTLLDNLYLQFMIWQYYWLVISAFSVLTVYTSLNLHRLVFYTLNNVWILCHQHFSRIIL